MWQNQMSLGSCSRAQTAVNTTRHAEIQGNKTIELPIQRVPALHRFWDFKKTRYARFAIRGH